MRILLISNKAPYPPKDGASIAVFNMALGMVSNNQEVHLLCINTKKHYRPDHQIPESFANATHYKSVFRNTGVTILGAIKNLFSKESYFVSRFYFEEFSRALKEKLTSFDFDIIQIEGVFMAVYLPIIRKYSNAKVTLRAHNVEHLIWERYLESSASLFKNIYIKIQKDRLRKFEFEAFAQVDAIIPITEIDGNLLKDMLPNKPVFTSITGLDLERYPHITKVKEPNTIFYFGSMDWLPNVEAVQWFKNNCWEKIKTETVNLRWIIAGINMPQHLMDYAKVDPNIVIINNVPDALEFYKTYNVQLVPILSGSGLRIKLVEGISYGKPIITTSIGMEGLHCKNGEQLLVEDDIKMYIEAVIKLVNNKNDIQLRLSENARNYAIENFENKKITNKLINFYKALEH